MLREAVRLVEHQHVARMRRGPGGGLIVTEPSIEAIIDAAVLYLYRVGARLDEVFAARLTLEELVTQLAPERLVEADRVRLRELVHSESEGLVRDHRAVHALLAATTKNPALEIFVEILNRVTLLYFVDVEGLTPAILTEAARAHSRIVDAVIDRDPALARRRMKGHLQAEAAFLRRRRSTRQVLDPTTAVKGAGGAKRVEEVAREIYLGVVSGRLVPSTFIGSEADLMDRFDVSRAIIREAVRLLEHHHIASMQRGPGGGLLVGVATADAATDVLALYLERNGIRSADVSEVRMGVELSMVDLVIDNLDDSGARRLRASLEAAAGDDGSPGVAHDLHSAVAAMSGNRVLELVSVILIRLSNVHEEGAFSARARRRGASEVARAHRGIVEALIARDRELARGLMLRHLEVVSGCFS